MMARDGERARARCERDASETRVRRRARKTRKTSLIRLADYHEQLQLLLRATLRSAGGLHDKIVMRALLHQAQLAWVFLWR